MIYENLRQYFPEYYYNSNQIEIFDPYSKKYELDIYTIYSEDYHNILPFIFGLYIIFSLFYINNIKSSFKRQMFVYYEKLKKIQNEHD